MQEYVSDALVGTLVDNRYQVQSRLARGGMSTVYLATDQRLERDVALKVLHPHLADDPQFLDRLGREAKAAARLSHPHVVGVLDQGEDGRLAYLVMEYIKGHTLRDVLNDKGALSPRLALALIDPVVEGLGAAHAAGMIHRDIKPENVLIADDGRIKLGDFGLARAISTSTSTGALIGTVAYLSPELVLGKQADARSDIYSVGIMLYEMITGRQPFDGEVPIQVAYQHVNSTVGAALRAGARAGRGDRRTRPVVHRPATRTSAPSTATPCCPNSGTSGPTSATPNSTSSRRRPSAARCRPWPPRQPGRPAAPVRRRTRRRRPTAAAQRPAAGTAHRGATAACQQPTEMISRTQRQPDHRDVRCPAASRPTGRCPLRTRRPTGAAGYGEPAEAPRLPPSKRAQRKLDRDEEKARQRAAATPTRTLHEGNPRRRGLLWIVLLVVAALLAAVAGWFFGMGPGSPGTVPPVANKTVAEAQAPAPHRRVPVHRQGCLRRRRLAGPRGRLRPDRREGHPEVPARVAGRVQGPGAVPAAGPDRQEPWTRPRPPSTAPRWPWARLPRRSTRRRLPEPSWPRRRAAATRSGTGRPWA